MAHEDITHQVSKQPNTWILHTKFPKIPPIGDITHAMGFQNFVLENREEDPSEAPSFIRSLLFCYREHGWSIRLQYSREFVHFTHNPRSSPFTDKTMARLSLSIPSTFWIQPCQEPPNVGTQVRFPTKY